MQVAVVADIQKQVGVLTTENSELKQEVELLRELNRLKGQYQTLKKKVIRLRRYGRRLEKVLYKLNLLRAPDSVLSCCAKENVSR